MPIEGHYAFVVRRLALGDHVLGDALTLPDADEITLVVLDGVAVRRGLHVISFSRRPIAILTSAKVLPLASIWRSALSREESSLLPVGLEVMEPSITNR